MNVKLRSDIEQANLNLRKALRAQGVQNAPTTQSKN